MVSIPAFLVRVQGVVESNLGGGQFVISRDFVQPLQQNARQDRSFIDVNGKGVKNDCKLRTEKHTTKRVTEQTYDISSAHERNFESWPYEKFYTVRKWKRFYAFWTPVRFTDKLAALNAFTVEYAPYTTCSIYNTRWHTKGRIPWAPNVCDINHSNVVYRSDGSVGWKVFACASNKRSRISEYLKRSICPILTLVHSLILSSLLRQLHRLFSKASSPHRST